MKPVYVTQGALSIFKSILLGIMKVSVVFIKDEDQPEGKYQLSFETNSPISHKAFGEYFVQIFKAFVFDCSAELVIPGTTFSLPLNSCSKEEYDLYYTEVVGFVE